MLLTLTTTARPATDLGYLLLKNPQTVLTRPLPFGQATVFYPQASAERCTAALLLEVDPVALSRRSQAGEGTPLEPYVNDRPYVAGSFLAVALREVFRTAMGGVSRERPELAASALPLVAELPCLVSWGGRDWPQRLFGPLGYEVEVRPLTLDPQFPEWGDEPYLALRLSATVRLSELLRHLYVLLPVLDGKKHYFLDQTEIDKLQRHGEGWLDRHPERQAITQRYLRFRELVEQADGEEDPPEAPQARLPRAHDERLDTVAGLLRDSGARSVLDLGCGEGKLLERLIPHAGFRRLVGVDLSAQALTWAARRLHLAERPELQERVQLLHGSLNYPDSRLRGFDAAALVEVIEHLEPQRLTAVAENVFGFARPAQVIVTTPNRDHNALLPEPGALRHRDHRFEWSRAEFREWAQEVARQYGYQVELGGVGTSHPELGPLTQYALFRR